MTVAEALALGTVLLREAGIESAGHDAEVLLRHVLRWDRARLLADAERALPPGSEASFLGLLSERAARRPLQYLTGTQWFWRHEFLVTPDVLIPRPETELVVEAALDLLRDLPTPVIADVGTGSGCIALSLAVERPDAAVSGIDISSAALAVARRNASRLGVAARLHFLQGDLLEPLQEAFGGIDLVVSNPPYVDRDEAPDLAPEVRLHEPAPALYPPSERYSVYRRLAPQAALALRPGGTLLLEVGHAMRGEVARICEGAGLRVERVVNDLQGIPRVVVTRKPPHPSEPGENVTRKAARTRRRSKHGSRPKPGATPDASSSPLDPAAPGGSGHGSRGGALRAASRARGVRGVGSRNRRTRFPWCSTWVRWTPTCGSTRRGERRPPEP